MKASKADIFKQLQGIMHELFEIEPKEIKLSSTLYEDLDIDSIDAVDLIAHLQSVTGRKFNPEEFKSVWIIEDVVNVIYAELSK